MFYDSVAYQEEINKPHSEKESKIIEFPTITEKKLKKTRSSESLLLSLYTMFSYNLIILMLS